MATIFWIVDDYLTCLDRDRVSSLTEDDDENNSLVAKVEVPSAVDICVYREVRISKASALGGSNIRLLPALS